MNLKFQLPFLMCIATVIAISILIFSANYKSQRKYYQNIFSDNCKPIPYDIVEKKGITELDNCIQLHFTLIYGKYSGKSFILCQDDNKSQNNMDKCSLPVVILHELMEEQSKNVFNLKRMILIDFVKSRIVLHGLGLDSIDIPKVAQLPENKELNKILPLGQEDHFKILRGKNSIIERILKCFKMGLIPVLNLRNIILPFSEVLQWENALLRANQRYIASNLNLTNATIFNLKRNGFLIYQRYFSSKERYIDFVLATIQHKLGHTPPFHQDAVLDYFPMDYHILPNKTRVQYPMTAEENKYLWNVAFFPWRRTPTDFLRQSDHRMDRYANEGGGIDTHEQFTVVCMTYNRAPLLRDLLELFKGLKQVKSVIIIWNNPDSNPNADPNIIKLLSAVAKEDLPPVVIAKPTKNSMNNRLLPLELITTDCIFLVDDDIRRLEPKKILSGFMTWQEHRDNLVGFQSRHVKANKKGEWEYDASNKKKISIVLIGTSFYHKFYAYKYTYEMSPSLRDKVDELMNCDDLFLNGLVQATTGLAPVMADKNIDYSCGKPCEMKVMGKGLHTRASHYKAKY